jgi:hypothetical protein
VQHFSLEGSTFRVNVGLFNGDGEHAITHRITLYSADGQVAAERTLTLQPYASLQRRLEHLFRMEVGSLPVGTYGMTVLPLDDRARAQGAQLGLRVAGGQRHQRSDILVVTRDVPTAGSL